MQRVNVVGTSGSGKSTLAQSLAEALDAGYVELDAIFHQPNWTSPPDDEFRSAIATAILPDTWVVDGGYSIARPLIWEVADTVVWLDPSKKVVMYRIIKRTLWRGLLGKELWNGNREKLGNIFKRNPMENIIAWAWTTYPDRRRRYSEMMHDPQWSHLDFVRLRTRAETRRFLKNAGRGWPRSRRAGLHLDPLDV